MTDLFQSESKTPTSDQTPQSYLEALVGEGKKYKDPEALAKGALYKDEHISKVETENATLRSELQKRMTTEELLQKIREESSAASRSSLESTNPLSQPNAPSDTINREEILNLVHQTIEQDRKLTVAQQNVNRVRQELETAFGSEYQEKLRLRTKELGLTEEFVKAMAAETPAALINIIVGSPPRENPNAFAAPRSSQPRMESTNPMRQEWDQAVKNRSYRDPKLQLKLHQMSIEAGKSILD